MSSFRVLHIDDEPAMREIVALSLELDPEFTVLGCASGQEGLPAAEQWRPDVIILDAVMPAMDGPATLGKLRENPQTSGIPVLFMTAQSQPRELCRLKSLGALDIIAKPFQPLMLAALVRGHLLGHGCKC
jgi:two-component system OmpR family response regulator